jgi:SAM-dependent methyltransferase
MQSYRIYFTVAGNEYAPPFLLGGGIYCFIHQLYRQKGDIMDKREQIGGNKFYLNLGCGEAPIADARNVDITEGKYVDEVIDLRKFPWKWGNESIDGIYMLHFLEHLPNVFETIGECHRILKVGGFLYLQIPHSSSVGSLGGIEHYRTFSYGISRFLTNPNWYWDKPLFKTVIKERVIWLGLPRNKRHKYITFAVEHKEPLAYQIIRKLFFFVQPMIDASPFLFERGWCFYVGGAHEIVWKGIKI